MSEQTARVYYVDWLRVLAVLLLLPFHTLRVYNLEPFYVKGAEVGAINYVLGFIDLWHMPLLFALAGASTFFALRKRSGRQYVSERFSRLGIPFLFGFFVLIPPQTWIGARFNSGYTESFLTYITSGDFLRWNVQDGGDYYGGLGLGHLWFLLWLLMISLAALPLLLWARDRGAERFGRFARHLARPAGWLTAAAIILVGEGLPDLFGKNPFYYGAFFVLGYAIASSPDFAEKAERIRWLAIGLGSALCVAHLVTWQVRDALPDPSLGRIGFAYGAALAVWMMLVGFIGLGRRHLDRPSRALSYLGPASYPLYILHQTVIVVLAYLVVNLALAWPAEWALLLVLATTVTFALYEAIRRVRPLHPFFGMK